MNVIAERVSKAVAAVAGQNMYTKNKAVVVVVGATSISSIKVMVTASERNGGGDDVLPCMHFLQGRRRGVTIDVAKLPPQKQVYRIIWVVLLLFPTVTRDHLTYARQWQ